MTEHLTYRIVRRYQHSQHVPETIARGLTLDQAQAYLSGPESWSLTAVSDADMERIRTKGHWVDSCEIETSTPKIKSSAGTRNAYLNPAGVPTMEKSKWLEINGRPCSREQALSYVPGHDNKFAVACVDNEAWQACLVLQDYYDIKSVTNDTSGRKTVFFLLDRELIEKNI